MNIKNKLVISSHYRWSFILTHNDSPVDGQPKLFKDGTRDVGYSDWRTGIIFAVNWQYYTVSKILDIIDCNLKKDYPFIRS